MILSLLGLSINKGISMIFLFLLLLLLLGLSISGSNEGFRRRYIIDENDVTSNNCPFINENVFGICVQECSSSLDCRRGEFCCFNGCGYVCM